MITARIFLVLTILNLAIRSANAGDTNLMVGYCTADFAAAKSAGFDFAEVRIREFMKLSDGDFDKFEADCRRTGLPLTTAYWFLPNEMKVSGPDVDMNAVTNYFAKSLDRCARLGVKFIVWGSGDARRIPAGFSKEQAFQQLVTLGKILATEAKKRGIIIVAEPLRHQESNTINSAAEGLKWVEAVDHPNFQLLVDIYHMTEEHEDAAIIVKAGAHIAHVHMSNPQGRVFPLKADEFDYKPFFNALRQIGYHGTVSIEAKTSDLAVEGPKAIEFIHSAYATARTSATRDMAK